MKIQYNIIFENKKQQQKYSKFKILNVLLQYMISPFFGFIKSVDFNVKVNFYF
jgi:hypothetical protein